MTWFPAVPPNDHSSHLAAARTALSTTDRRVLITADSWNRAAQQNFASQTPEASTVEAVDLQDLIAFASNFDVGSTSALVQLTDDTSLLQRQRRQCDERNTRLYVRLEDGLSAGVRCIRISKRLTTTSTGPSGLCPVAGVL